MIVRKWLLKLGMVPYQVFYNVFCFFTKTKDKISIISNVKVEDNAVAMANYLAEHTNRKIELWIPEKQIESSKQFVNSRVELRKAPRYLALSWRDLKSLCSASHVLMTYQFLHGSGLHKQTFVNLWHGLTYKKIQHLRKYDGIPAQADFHVSGSVLTQQMNAEIFNAKIDQILISGLPRNDLLLRTSKNKSRAQLPGKLRNYSKILMWMPTYRRLDEIGVAEDLNVFAIKNFDTNRFNEVLKTANTLCIVKTHHAIKSKVDLNQSNILLIDDDWLVENNFLLYEFLAYTDALISDYSSVMIDYMLLNRPVFCIATDLEEYKKTQGLCFNDYENWVPSKLYTSQNEFIDAVQYFLETGKDVAASKRKKCCAQFFENQDEYSAKRISEYFNF